MPYATRIQKPRQVTTVTLFITYNYVSIRLRKRLIVLDLQPCIITNKAKKLKCLS